MSRIVEEQAIPAGAGRFRSGSGAGQDVKNVLERVAKNVPAEIIAGYVMASGFAENAKHGKAPLLGIIFGVCLICTPIYILQHYVHERQRIGRRYGVGPQTGRTCPEFFCSAESNKGMSETTLIRLVRSVRDAAQVPFTIHALRHSFVTELVRSGARIQNVSALAGHTRITTTEMYFRAYDPDNRDAVRRLNFRTRPQPLRSPRETR